MELISVAATFDVLYKQGFPCWGSESWIINSVLPTQGLPSHQYQKEKKKKEEERKKENKSFLWLTELKEQNGTAIIK